MNSREVVGFSASLKGIPTQNAATGISRREKCAPNKSMLSRPARPCGWDSNLILFATLAEQVDSGEYNKNKVCALADLVFMAPATGIEPVTTP